MSKRTYSWILLTSFNTGGISKHVLIRWLQMISLISWQLPQQVLGVLYGLLLVVLGKVQFVTYLQGAIVVRTTFGGGLTLGNIITSSTSSLDAHEWGHVVQSSLLGPFYLIVIGIPSIVRASGISLCKWLGYLKGFGEVEYYKFYPESTANWLTARFLKSKVVD